MLYPAELHGLIFFQRVVPLKYNWFIRYRLNNRGQTTCFFAKCVWHTTRLGGIRYIHLTKRTLARPLQYNPAAAVLQEVCSGTRGRFFPSHFSLLTHLFRLFTKPLTSKLLLTIMRIGKQALTIWAVCREKDRRTAGNGTKRTVPCPYQEIGKWDRKNRPRGTAMA